jgi:hypothetical protein
MSWDARFRQGSCRILFVTHDAHEGVQAKRITHDPGNGTREHLLAQRRMGSAAAGGDTQVTGERYEL